MAFVLCAMLLVSLCACGSSDSAPATEGGAATHGFLVGYSKQDVTPSTPAPLYGYGNPSERMHTEVLDPLYLTCVTMTDAQDTTVMFVTIDICRLDDNSASSLRAKISSATGVPKENIMVSVTHTHSAPQAAAISNALLSAAAKAGKDAMDDRKEAKMYIGTGETDGINFIRHYVLDDGSVVGDNHGTWGGKVHVGHTTEVDEEMRVIQFKREGAKDVVIANWQSHPHMTGGASKTSLSADIIGMFRMYMENDTGCLFAYYQGGAGNINPTSRIQEENANSEKNYKIHGQKLAETCKLALQNATEAELGLIQIQTATFEAGANREDLNLASDAVDVVSYYEAGHTIDETATYAQTNYGIQSLYHAQAIGWRGGLPEVIGVEVNAISFGSVAWVTAPFEIFDTNAKYVRDNSPYEMTFYNAYCNGGNGYLASQAAWEYGCYEADTAAFARGTAELLSEQLLSMLNELHG